MIWWCMICTYIYIVQAEGGAETDFVGVNGVQKYFVVWFWTILEELWCFYLGVRGLGCELWVVG